MQTNLILDWENKQYVNSRCFDNPVYKEILLSKNQGKETDELINIFCNLSNSLALRYKINISDYDRDDLIQEGILAALKYWRLFDTEKTNNAQAYITQIIKSAHAGIFYKLKKHHENNIHI